MVTGRVRQVVVLYSHDFTGTCLGGSALAVLKEWPFYRGGRLNRFDCILRLILNLNVVPFLILLLLFFKADLVMQGLHQTQHYSYSIKIVELKSLPVSNDDKLMKITIFSGI